MRFHISLLFIILFGCGGGGGSAPAPPRDVTPPVITLIGDNPQVVITGNPYIELGASAQDNMDGIISASITIDAGAVDTTTVGEYLVAYDVTDTAGNPAATVTRTVSVQHPPGPDVTVSGDIKTLIFDWTESEGAEFYRLLENVDGHSGFSQIGNDIPADIRSAKHSIAVHLFDWINAFYVVEACNLFGCNTSDAITVDDIMLESIGYFKASNTGTEDEFGVGLVVSSDGETLVVGSPFEDGDGRGVDADQGSDSAEDSGAVYVFELDGSNWVQQAYIKSSNSDPGDLFGWSISISDDGEILAVGALHEDSGATGVNGNESDNSADSAGAVYIYQKNGIDWIQQAYIKASNTDPTDRFSNVSLSADGMTLAVGASSEESAAIGVNGDQSDNSSQPFGSGAVYIFRNVASGWFQEAYVKASNTEEDDMFGASIALSADGNTLVVGAVLEASAATGIGGDQGDNSARQAGAAYIFGYDGTDWSQQAYVKASNTDEFDRFGGSVAIRADGNRIAVAAYGEDSDAVGVNGDQDSDLASSWAGAVYIFERLDSSWKQTTYLKASNTGSGDNFGESLSMSADGSTIAVGATCENSIAAGVGGDQFDDSLQPCAGAAYVFRFDGMTWTQLSYVKASNSGPFNDFVYDLFGSRISLSGDGKSLAVAAIAEDSAAMGVSGNQEDRSANQSGAVYLY
jgi:hypothetical protein